VHITPDRYDDVLHTPGAVRFVFFGGKPATIPARQIDTLKAVTGSNVEVDAISLGGLRPGRQVRVIAGPLSGITGELLRVGTANKVVIRIEHLAQGLILSISPLLLEAVSM
jgi:transcription antitermination factor NusG